MQIKSIGIDLGKTTFHLVALGDRSQVVIRKKFSRSQLLVYTANLPGSLIGMEAGVGAHFLGRALREETKASSILQFIHGLRGELHVTWEEGTWAAWLYDLLQPQVAPVLVCDPRRNALLKEGSKSDKVDARKLADLLRTGMLRPVYHGEHGLRTLRELGRSYQTLNQDLNRVMNRIKALYRGGSIPCAGTQVYAPRYREEWLQKIEHAGGAPACRVAVSTASNA